MDNQEALCKINEIHQVIEGSNQALFSGDRMIAIGIGVALIPVIEWLTHGLTFGIEFGPNRDFIIMLIHTVFYWALFGIGFRALPFKKMDRNQLHPLIRKAFSIYKPFLVGLFGLIFAFSAINQGQLIHPVVFILLGLFFSLHGRFSIPAVSYIAWSYIIIGPLYAYMTKFNIPNLWTYLTVYNGLSYVVMGLFLRRARLSA